ncbi:hypothetical protein SAMN04515674_11499 [Pseudarcicella hirudinis]|uniref:Uncharacterized protein n=1 Tax=Pseudarcicella hirudinis TaxID=1079859 RepID=A0A1I5XER7_9BACT|nr:hypothetical protein [Pseudarcicella hirudinis]SFQ30455.1 hypothetical protein SAMN04515674_11499 [Pseudarcicella hirudinis]
MDNIAIIQNMVEIIFSIFLLGFGISILKDISSAGYKEHRANDLADNRRNFYEFLRHSKKVVRKIT